MQLHVTDVMNRIEIARQALTHARDEMLHAIHDDAASGHQDALVLRIQEQLDEAIALMHTGHEHLQVWQRIDAHRRVQRDLDSYQGSDSEETAQYVHSRPDQNNSYRSTWASPIAYDASADDEDPYYGIFGDGEAWPSYGGTHDDDDDDNNYIDIYEDIESDSFLEMLLKPHTAAVQIILGDERASDAFDTSDMSWADQPLHEEEYRQLFGLPLTPNGDWHYDIFGQWHVGRYQPPAIDDPDYNTPSAR